MGFVKGMKRPSGAGRKKGTPNKINWNARELAEKLGINPLEVLLRFSSGDWEGLGYKDEHFFQETSSGSIKMTPVISSEMRMKASAEASKYLFPTKKAVEVSTDGEKGFRVIIEDYASKDKK